MFRQVFDPDNLFWRIMARGVDFVGLSIFWLALCLPVVTIGPATAALYYTVVKVFRHKSDDGAFGMYWKAFVQNLRRGIPATLIFIPVMLLLAYGYAVMRANAVSSQGVVMFVAYYIVLLIPMGMFCYLFPMMGRFDMSVKELFRTSFILAIRHLPSTFVVVLLTVQMVVFGLERWWPVVFAPTLTILLVSLFLERIFPKYLNDEERARLEDKPPEDETEDERESQMQRSIALRQCSFAFGKRMKLHDGGHQLGQSCGQLGVTGAGQVHKVDLIEFAALGVHKAAAQPGGDLLVLLGHALRTLHAAFAHGVVVEAGLDGGGRDDQDVGLMTAPAVHTHGLAHQPVHAQTDAGGIGAEALLGVVGAQHDDEQVDVLMALEQGIGNAERVHALMERVNEHCGAAGQALLGDQILLAQRLLQQAGPALVLVEADAAVSAVGGVGAIAMGVGIAQAENMLFHMFHVLCPIVRK